MELCWPLNFLQFILQIIGGILIMLGFGKIWTGIDIVSKLDQSGEFNALVIIGVSVFVVFGGALICWGASSTNRFIICFQTTMASLMLMTYAITCVFYYEVLKNPQICENKNSQEYNLSIKANEYFCSANCECYIQNENQFPPQYLNGYVYNYTNQSSPINFQMCSQFSSIDKAKAEEMRKIEIRHKCAGWCQPSAIYQFSDVNSGVPEHFYSNHACFYQHQQEINTILARQLFFNFALCLFLLLAIFLSCCICFHPERDVKHERIYKFIKYFDDL